MNCQPGKGTTRDRKPDGQTLGEVQGRLGKREGTRLIVRIDLRQDCSNGKQLRSSVLDHNISNREGTEEKQIHIDYKEAQDISLTQNVAGADKFTESEIKAFVSAMMGILEVSFP